MIFVFTLTSCIKTPSKTNYYDSIDFHNKSYYSPHLLYNKKLYNQYIDYKDWDMVENQYIKTYGKKEAYHMYFYDKVQSRDDYISYEDFLKQTLENWDLHSKEYPIKVDQYYCKYFILFFPLKYININNDFDWIGKSIKDSNMTKALNSIHYVKVSYEKVSSGVNDYCVRIEGFAKINNN